MLRTLLASCCLLFTGNLVAAKRPNIVMVFADDWGRYASIYAALEPGGISDLVQTPNFDRIAREGVLFTQAYVNAPSCTPCRSSLLSGQYFWRTGRGAILSGAVWDAAIPSYPLLLENDGYHIGHTYKVWSPGTPADAPHGGKRAAFVQAGRQFNQFSQFVSKQQDHAQAIEKLKNEIRGNVRSFMQARPDAQPFCYWLGPTNPHRKWVVGSGQDIWGLDPEKLKGKLPPFLPDVPEVREDICSYLGEVQGFDTALGVLLEELEKTGELDNTLIAVSGDHGIPGFPRGKCNLYDFGVRVPLAIRWPAKVPAGRVVDDFVCLPDLAPTFLEAAGLKPPEVMTARSLIPILLSEKTGQVDPTRDAVVVGRERHVDTARTDTLPYPQRALRTKDFLYIRNFKPDRWPMGTAPGFGEPPAPFPSVEAMREETRLCFRDMDAGPTKAWLIEHRNEPEIKPLFDIAFGLRPAEEFYDLRTDPHQMRNVAQDARYASDRMAMENRLLEILKSSGDPRVTGDGSTFDEPPFTGKASK